MQTTRWLAHRGPLPSSALLTTLAVSLGVALAMPPSNAQAQNAAPTAAEQANPQFDVPAGALDQALTTFAQHAGVALVFDPAQVQGLQSRGLHGRYSVDHGFTLLLQGSGLHAVRTAQGNYRLQRVASAGAGVGVSTLSAVQVTGRYDPREAAFETPGAVTVVTKDDLNRIQARHASEVLQAVTGVYTVTNEQNPSVSVDIRGLKDFGRVNMSIDGMRQNYQRTGHQQRNGEMFFDTEFLSGIKIEKGALSGAGSLGTIGGIADFQTIEPEDVWLPGQDIGVRVRGRTGVGGYANGQKFNGSLAFAFKAHDTLDVLVAAAGRRSDEYAPGTRGHAFHPASRAEGFHPPLVSQSNQDQDSGLLKLRWRPAAGHELKFTALHTRVKYAETSMQDYGHIGRIYGSCYDYWFGDKRDDPSQQWCGSWPGPDDVDIYPQDSTSQTKSTSLGLDYAYKPAGNSLIDLKAKLYYVDTEDKTINTSSQDLEFQTRTETIGMWAHNTALFTLSPNWQLDWTLGAEFFLDRNKPKTQAFMPGYDQEGLDVMSRATPTGRKLSAGWHTQARFTYSDWLEITPGLRYDWYRLQGDTGFNLGIRPAVLPYRNIHVDRKGGRFLPSLNIAVTPVQNLQLFAYVGKGARSPAITEALISSYHPGGGAPIRYYPNYLLKSELTTSMELGMNLRFDDVARQGDRLRLKASVFRNKTRNYTFFGTHVCLPEAVPNNGCGNFISPYTMYVQAVDPVVFRGLELEADYDAGSWFFHANATRLQRDANFGRLRYPLGGAVGPEAATKNQAIEPGSASFVMYVPAPPKWNGRATLGMRLLDRKLEASATLRCASKGSERTGEEQDVGMGQNSFCVWDAQLAYQFNRNLRFGLNLDNIRDREYAQAMSDTWVRSYAPGRTLTAFMEARF